MNLNGNKNTKTILNGKPLYNYDLKKKNNYLKHSKKHKEYIKKSRTNIGEENFERLEKKSGLLNMIALIIFIIIATILFILIISGAF